MLPEPLESQDHESKYVLDARQIPAVLGRLRARCRPDPRHPGGIVASLYYDTPGLSSLSEKQNGTYEKIKVRLRWYEDPITGEPCSEVFVETKIRIGTRRIKRRRETDLAVRRLRRQALDDADLAELPRRLGVAEARLTGALLPIVEIAYHRSRFVDPGTGSRLCLDERVVARRTNPALLAPPDPRPLSAAVLEVKSVGGALPPSLCDLASIGCGPDSFSKYGACLESLCGMAC